MILIVCESKLLVANVVEDKIQNVKDKISVALSGAVAGWALSPPSPSTDTLRQNGT